MRFTTCVVTMLLYAIASAQYDLVKVNELRKRLDNGESSDDVFPDFMSVFEKTYLDDNERAVRKSIFHDNVLLINNHNLLYAKGQSSYSMAVNQFSDMTPDEFEKSFSTHTLSLEDPTHLLPSEGRNFKRSLSIPLEKDWRNENCVTPVKNQGIYGTCYAFATTGAMECLAKRETGELVELSVQQLITCSPYKCDGGLRPETFNYIKKAGGMMRSSDLPYKPWVKNCTFDARRVVKGTKISGYRAIPPGNKADLLKAVANVGPVSIGIDTKQLKDFQSPEKGIMAVKYPQPRNITHAVLIVGYGTESKNDYWLVKNSYGDSWGQNGYFKILRYMNSSDTVATRAIYPVKGTNSGSSAGGSSKEGAANDGSLTGGSLREATALAAVVGGIIMFSR